MSTKEISTTDNVENQMITSKPKKRLFTILAAVGVLFLMAFGFHYWKYTSTHVSTEDSYLTADIVQIAPQVSGTVAHVYVKDNEYVKAGQLLATLDDSTYKAAVDQAQANLDAAIAAAEGSGVNVALIGDTGNAQIEQSTAGVSQTESAVGSSEADVSRTRALVSQAAANAQGVKASISTGKASIAAALAQRKRADAAVESAAAQVETAEAAVRSSNAALESAKAVSAKATKDNERYQTLLAKSVIGAQMAEQAAVAEQTAKSQLQAAYEQVSSNKANLNAKQADLRAAKEQINAADAAIDQAKAQLSAAQEQYTAADAGISQAKAQLQVSLKSVEQSRARHQQALAQLMQAKTAPKQVAMSEAAAHQAIAKVKQAQAALADAQMKLSYTRIIAPVSGRVSKKSVHEGILVQPGTPLMALVPPPSENIWVVANFKETQLSNVKEGQSATIKVDSLPGRHFKAKVDSISSGTGATFALLPPDNATGNFTKVVQRIPVKLVIEPNQSDIDRLRAGMSVTAVISTR